MVYIKARNVVEGLEPDDTSAVGDSCAACGAHISEPHAPDCPVADASVDLDESSVPDPVTEQVTATAEPVVATRFTHDGTVLVPSGEKARARANIAALEVITACAEQNRPATPAEQDVLAAWSGWGAASAIFDESKPEWAPEREQLRGLLDVDGYRQARGSTLNAHYTDPAIAAAMWSALARAGFDGGLVLEPGCGSGNFIGLAPDAAQMVGVEVDPTTAQIAHLLYPDAQIRMEGFETTRVPSGSFAATVGNVPFGGFSVHDPVHNAAGHRIHNHFILKAIDLTAPGGYVAVITSAGTMDAAKDSARQAMHASADLVGAVRLPSTAFDRVAGTRVVTDVLVFRRRDPDAAVPHPATVDWLSTDLVELPDRDGDLVDMRINRYFTTHPDRVIGELRVDRGLYRDGSLTVVADPGVDVAAAVDDRLTGIVDDAIERGWALDPTPSTEREFTAGALDAAALYAGEKPIGHVHYDPDTDTFTRRGIDGPEPVKVPASRRTETRHLLRLRDLTEATITSQRTGESTPAEREALRAELGRVYDSYVAAYGPISRFKIVGGKERTEEQATARYAALETKWRAANKDPDGVPYDGPLPDSVIADLEEQSWQASTPSRRQTHLEAVREDPAMAAVYALEHVDGQTGSVRKAAIFSRDVVVPPVPITHADSPQEAVAISLGERGLVDLDRVADLLDQTPAEAREAIRGLVFTSLDGSGDLVPAASMLSGNVRAKHDAAVALCSGDPGNADWAEVESALAAVIPPDKQPSQIGAVKLGPTWIAPGDYERFIVEVLGAPEATVQRAAGSWTITVPAWARNTPVMRSDYGADNEDNHKALDAVDLVDALMNQRSIVVTNSKAAREDTGAPEVDAKATILAQVQAEKIAGEFRSWLWSDEERTERLLTEWNRRFNTWVRPAHDGSQLVFPGLSPQFSPHPYQRDAVARILAEPTVLLDHVVGAGKTGTMFMSAMELKRRGLVQQPWIVVPTHLIEQFGREVKQWYPAANVLLGRKGMTAEDRRVFAAQTATSDWDIVIVPSSVFEKINVHPRRRVDYIERQLDELRAELEPGDGVQPSQATVKKIELATKQLRKRLEAATDAANKDPGVLFEDTGADYLYVDEAHEYKNKGRTCAIDSLSLVGSNKAEDLSMKLDYLRERQQDRARATGRVVTPGAERVATFATGTPIANSLAESWVMQQYLRPDVLEVAGVRSITDWAASFTATKSETVTNSTGTKLKVVSTVSQFSNPKEMFAMSAQYTDVVVRSQVPVDLPTHSGRQIITSTPGQERRDFIADLDYRADHLDPAEAHIDNVLKILNDGRNVAIDPVLANLDPDPGNTRADAVAAQVARIHEASKDNEYRTDDGQVSPVKGALQLVFCDRGTPKPGSESVYSRLKDILVDTHGIPAEKIAFIHDAKSPAQRDALFADCVAGRVAVLVGSTQKMGTGMNVQQRMIALHHMDVPWRPADLEQREGRIIRQRNQNREVEILNYVTEGTTDTVMWGKVESKAAFIEQAKTGQLDDVTEVEDIDSDSMAGAAAATKAAATGDERFMLMATLDDEVKQLSALSAAHADARNHARRAVAAADREIPQRENEIEVLTRLTTDHDAWNTAGRTFTVGGQSFTERPERSAALRDRAVSIWHELKGKGMSESMPLAEFPNGVTARAARIASSGELWVWLDTPGRPDFTIAPKQLFPDTAEGGSAIAAGLATRVENLNARLPLLITDRLGTIDRLHREIEIQSPRMDAVFDRADELQAKQVQLRTLRMEIQKAEQSEEAIAARAAAAQRLAAAGRAPGWSLELNPTTAMVEESPFPDAATYVHATKKAHLLNAEKYRREHPHLDTGEGAAPRGRDVGSLLADTRPDAAGHHTAPPTLHPRQAPPTVDPHAHGSSPEMGDW